MNIEVSTCWQSTDKNLLFNIPYVGDYEAIDFFGKYNGNFATDGTGSLFYANGSLNNVPQANWVSGHNVWDNTKKEIDFVINGALGSSKNIESKTTVCRDNKASWCV